VSANSGKLCPPVNNGGLQPLEHRYMLPDVSDHQSSRSDSPPTVSEGWLSASETHRRIVTATLSLETNLAIAQRAHAGALRAKALMFITGPNAQPDAEVPKEFWWAGGREALEQNWQTGDFETWIDRKTHMRALGVSFHLGDLQKTFPDVFKADDAIAKTPSSVAKPGRPPAEWWDDLWIDICRRLYEGELQPKKQADIEGAMSEWITLKTGKPPSTSNVRSRASKLWRAIKREDEK
jgi:hypothetical protein